MRKHILSVAFFGIAVVFPAAADDVYAFKYSGTPSSTTHPENVEADFTVIGSSLQVTLFNTISNLTFDTQVLTGVAFTFAGAGSTAGSLTNPLVSPVNVNDANGTTTPVGGNPTSANWGTFTSCTGCLANYVTLTNIGVTGNSSGAMGLLSNTLASSTNNLNQHGPFIQTGTSGLQFTISGLGLTSASQITGLEFNWGTGLTSYSTGVPGTDISATPEPGTMLGGTLGLVMLALGLRRRTTRLS